MSLFRQFNTGEFTPFFRFLDDYATHSVSRGAFPSTSLRGFQPRFDVKEVKEGYQLEGELPGVDQSNVEIEFTDPQTLSIRGRTERSYESGTAPASIAGQAEQAKLTDGTKSPKAHQATVEDEGAESATAVAASTSAQEVTPQEPEEQQQRYYISERSVGTFHRTFNFPTRVDQDNVKASLKDGILSILVPRSPAPTSRKINIE